LLRNNDLLADHGLKYSDYCLSGSSHSQLALCLPSGRADAIRKLQPTRIDAGAEMYRKYSGPSAEEVFSGLAGYVQSVDQPMVLVSSECFFEWLDPAHLTPLLSQIDAEVSVLVSLRRQDRWIESVYSQVVKDRGLRYAGRLDDLPQWELLGYRDILQAWARVVGPDAIRVSCYEEQAGKSAVMSRFLQMVGLEQLVPKLQEGDSGHTNSGLDAICTTVQARVNGIASLDSDSHAQVYDCLQYLSDEFRAQGMFSPWRISNELSQVISQQHWQDNHALFSEFKVAGNLASWGGIAAPSGAINEREKAEIVAEKLRQQGVLDASMIAEAVPC
jgi:hypothetical protein